MTAPRQPFFPADQSIRKDNDSPIAVQLLGTVDYLTAWDMQADLAAQRARGDIGDTIIIVLEHPSIYTAGKRTQPEDRPTNGLPVIDVVDYVRRVEEALIQVVRQAGVTTAGRIDGRSGVWVPGATPAEHRKIAALGIRITHGVTMHGLALNCDNTLEFYEHIIPCGISDAGVTTLSRELGRDVSVAEMIQPTLQALDDAFSGRLVVADHTFDSAPDPTKGLPRR